jgi:hypothetical protein
MSFFVIPIHSTVDLITNSSSELFILNSHLTADAVKLALNQLLKQAPYNTNYSNVFKDPKCAPFDIDPTLHPDWKTYLSLHDYDSPNSLMNVIEQHADHFLTINGFSAPSKIDDMMTQTQYNGLYMLTWNFSDNLVTKITNWVLEQNKLKRKGVPQTTIDLIHTAIYNEMQIKKGEICLDTASDNTVPENFYEVLTGTFNARSVRLS